MYNHSGKVSQSFLAKSNTVNSRVIIIIVLVLVASLLVLEVESSLLQCMYEVYVIRQRLFVLENKSLPLRSATATKVKTQPLSTHPNIIYGCWNQYSQHNNITLHVVLLWYSTLLLLLSIACVCMHVGNSYFQIIKLCYTCTGMLHPFAGLIKPCYITCRNVISYKLHKDAKVYMRFMQDF